MQRVLHIMCLDHTESSVTACGHHALDGDRGNHRARGSPAEVPTPTVGLGRETIIRSAHLPVPWSLSLSHAVGIAPPRGDMWHQPTSGWHCLCPSLSPPCLFLVLIFWGPCGLHVRMQMPHDSGPRTQGHLPSSGWNGKTRAPEPGVGLGFPAHS